MGSSLVITNDFPPRQGGLVDCERRGTCVYYWVIPGVMARLAGLFGQDSVVVASV